MIEKEEKLILQNCRKKLQKIGWSEKAIQEVFLKSSLLFDDEEKIRDHFQECQRFASVPFQKMWNIGSDNMNSQEAQALLKLAMNCLMMPKELSGKPEETKQLLARFSSDIAPHDVFWSLFSRTVQKAFPHESFASPTDNQILKRQIHQFRYVISAQQAQWVRNHYKKEGMCDSEALACFLRTLPRAVYSLKESSRLHNKAYINQHSALFYPDKKEQQANFKILMNFHTEFILDNQGNFLNELEPEVNSLNGIVNGASFNYGDKNSRYNHVSHTRYDVRTPKVWDPTFRVTTIHNNGKKFRAPKNTNRIDGYYSNKGIYARNGQSVKKQVDKEIRRFKKLLNKPSYWIQFSKCWRKIWTQLINKLKQ